MAKKRTVSHDTSSTSPDSTPGKQTAPTSDPSAKAPVKAAKATARKTPVKAAAGKPQSEKKTPDTTAPDKAPVKARPTSSARKKTPADAPGPAAAPAAPAKPVPAKTAAKRAPARKAAPVRREKPAGGLDIVMVASEMRPFATSGGLSEVLDALPQALTRLGHRVTVIIPRYRRVAIGPNIGIVSPTPHRAEPAADLEATIDMGHRQFRTGFYVTEIGERLSVVFVDVPELFDRDGLYGTSDGDYPDNAIRFAVFSRAALEYLRLRGRRPSVIHVHDWQAGLVPAYQKMLFSSDPVIGGVPVVFTIHNMAFQGIFPVETLAAIGLPRDVLHVEAMEFYGRISYLKAGINFSERITTVSPTYAREILDRQNGFGFEGVLARRSDDLIGILNGIDDTRWNPATDAFLPTRYSADDLSGKAEVKRFLLEASGLDATAPAFERPLIGLVSRLTDQKGFDLISAAAEELMALDAAWVMLGSGDRGYEEQWTMLAARFPDRVSATIGYDERLEHLIEGGADAFLMPSRFEPCGLNQLNSLRYGTLPIVRATGGLNDTVRDAVDGQPGTGFRFDDYTPEGLVAAVKEALDVYRTPERWREMQRAAMAGDFSWDVSAREYVKVYSVNS
jgi:starch synthase